MVECSLPNSSWKYALPRWVRIPPKYGVSIVQRQKCLVANYQLQSAGSFGLTMHALAALELLSRAASSVGLKAPPARNGPNTGSLAPGVRRRVEKKGIPGNIQQCFPHGRYSDPYSIVFLGCKKLSQVRLFLLYVFKFSTLFSGRSGKEVV